MVSPPDSIPILQMLVRLTNARRVVEVGVFTGCDTIILVSISTLPTVGCALTMLSCNMCAESESTSKGCGLMKTGHPEGTEHGFTGSGQIYCEGS